MAERTRIMRSMVADLRHDPIMREWHEAPLKVGDSPGDLRSARRIPSRQGVLYRGATFSFST